MKFRTRALTTVAVFALVTCFWSWTALRVRYQKALGFLPDRLVIFGDESSSTLSGPSGSLHIPFTTRHDHHHHRRSLSLPTTWPSTLCSRLRATCTSFAPQPTASSNLTVVDNLIFNTTLPDLRDQVSAFLSSERSAIKSGQTGLQRSSLFTLSFGTNDLWHFSSLPDLYAAESAVDASLDSIFDQLLRISQRWPDPLQVLMPRAIDITMTPAWKQTYTTRDTSGEKLRSALKLQRRWNDGLAQRAEKFSGGKVWVWEADEAFLEGIREERRWGWKARETCVKGNKKCERPEEYMMWDGLHLGPRAQGMWADGMVKYLL